jgi:hypothetical protein
MATSMSAFSSASVLRTTGYRFSLVPPICPLPTTLIRTAPFVFSATFWAKNSWARCHG